MKKKHIVALVAVGLIAVSAGATIGSQRATPSQKVGEPSDSKVVQEGSVPDTAIAMSWSDAPDQTDCPESEPFCHETFDPDAFTIAIIPDTQEYVWRNRDKATFGLMLDWIADNAAANNTVFASHVGDVVARGGRVHEWEVADDAMRVLDGVIPYGVTLGNHDYDLNEEERIGYKRSAFNFVEWFGPSRFTGESWYVDSSADGHNSAQIFSGGGEEYLHIALEWMPSDSALTWTKQVLDEYPDIPTILTTHQFLSPRGTLSAEIHDLNRSIDNSPQTVLEEIVEPYEQIFLVLSGHFTGDSRVIFDQDSGSQAQAILTDYQGDPRGGNGWFKLARVRPSLGEIEFRVISPTFAELWAGVDIDRQVEKCAAESGFSTADCEGRVLSYDRGSADNNDGNFILNFNIRGFRLSL